MRICDYDRVYLVAIREIIVFHMLINLIFNLLFNNYIIMGHSNDESELLDILFNLKNSFSLVARFVVFIKVVKHTRNVLTRRSVILVD